jgi:thiol-disulfide isomerase/thioredoxin
MNRRRFLTAAAGTGITVGAGWLALNGFSDDSGLPIRVETIRARGSETGHIRVPVPGAVSVIDLFATWCAPCVEQMETLSALHGTFGKQVRFVSVTNERLGGTFSRADLREWWHKYDGAWTLGSDPESDLMAALGAGGLPYLAVAAADGTIVWRHSGLTTKSTLQTAIKQALAR